MLKELVVFLCLCLLQRVASRSISKRTSWLPSDGDATAPVAQFPLNPFDAGPVGACETPAVGDATYCNINYPVPSNIARISAILDQEVMALIGGDELNECKTLEKEDLCAQRFPRCNDSAVMVSSATDCANRLQAVCSDVTAARLLDAGRCAAEQTFTASECKPLSEHDLGGFQFQRCNLSSEALLTAWMLEIVKVRDQELDELLSNELNPLASRIGCHEGHIRHICQIPGECNASGDRFVVLNTNQQCSSTRDCYGDVPFLGDLFSCEDWPNEGVSVVSPTAYHSDTPISTSPPASSSSSSSRHTPPTPGTRTLATLATLFDGGCIPMASLMLILLLLLLSLLL